MRSLATRGLAVLIVLLVAADWMTKFLITNRLALGETRAVVDGWFYVVHRRNPGVAFSVFADLPVDWRAPLLAGVAAVGVVVFVRILRSTRDRVAQLAAALVIAGAIGNMGDRLVTGEVIDFLHVTFFPFVFNLADAAITVGGALLTLRMFTAEETASPGSGPAPA